MDRASEAAVQGLGWVPPEGNTNEDRDSEKATDVGHVRAEGEGWRGHERGP